MGKKKKISFQPGSYHGIVSDKIQNLDHDPYFVKKDLMAKEMLAKHGPAEIWLKKLEEQEKASRSIS